MKTDEKKKVFIYFLFLPHYFKSNGDKSADYQNTNRKKKLFNQSQHRKDVDQTPV